MKNVLFVADVHLGLPVGDPAGREKRFVKWLSGIDAQHTETLYLLGDIWDFWYEYRDVIPSEGIRVVAQIIRLLDSGVRVVYVPGNHDIWLFSFWQSLGVEVRPQPVRASIQGRKMLLGHGDALGGAPAGYSLIYKVFHSRFCQKLFGSLHPDRAFRLGKGWSNSNRARHSEYHFRGKDEPLYRFCERECAREPVDICLFGHFHDSVDMRVDAGGGRACRLVVLKDWIDGGEHFACLSEGELEVQ